MIAMLIPGSTASAQASCPDGQFLAEYFPNQTMTGPAALTRCEASVSYATHSFANGRPAGTSASFPVDNFSIRFTGRHYFNGQAVTFSSGHDDGQRVWIDGNIVHDEWGLGNGNVHTFAQTPNQGMHDVKMEYREMGGGARVQLTWPDQGEPPPPAAATPRLVAEYSYQTEQSDPYSDNGPTLYRPASFAQGLQHTEYNGEQVTVQNPGPFAGADVFMSTNQQRGTASTWITFQMNRPSKVKMLWRNGTVHSWIAAQGWVERAYGSEPRVSIPGQEGCTTCKVFEKDVQAGPFSIGMSQYKTPWLLFFEADGSLSPYPTAPAGKTQPQANQSCPAWVHADQHPDTWHGQIDPVYWCYFRHDHGSDVRGFASDRPDIRFGQVAALASIPEPHEGFKCARFESTDWPGNLAHAICTHRGTAGPGRRTEPYHEFVHVAVDRATRATRHAVAFMADFGCPKWVPDGGAVQILRPSENPMVCEEALARGSTGERHFSDIGYEPWIPSTGQLVWEWWGFTFNDRDVMTQCASVTCPLPMTPTNGSGVRRTVAHGDGGNGYDRTMGPKSGGPSGTFRTNVFGTAVVQSGGVEQVIGATVSARTRVNVLGDNCTDFEANWRRYYVCGVSPFNEPKPRELENSMGLSFGPN